MGQTSYAGIIRIRFKATRSCGLLRSQPRMPLSAPVFMSSTQYTRPESFVKLKRRKSCAAFRKYEIRNTALYNKVIENRQTPRGEKTRVRGCEQYHLWCCKKKKSPKCVKNSVKKESFVWQTAASQRKNCQNFTGEILRFTGRGPCMGRFIYAMILFVVLYL